MSIFSLSTMTVTLEKPTNTRNTFGEITVTYTSSVDIKCTIQAKSLNVGIVNSMESLTNVYSLYTDSTAAFTINDRINDNGSYYKITGVNNNLKGHHQQIDLYLLST